MKKRIYLTLFPEELKKLDRLSGQICDSRSVVVGKLITMAYVEKTME